MTMFKHPLALYYEIPKGDIDPKLLDKYGRMPDAGELGKRCYRKACQATEGIFWYNRGTHKYYCEDCMHAITRWPENRDLFSRHFGPPTPP
jgi:hypothetical protein